VGGGVDGSVVVVGGAVVVVEVVVVEVVVVEVVVVGVVEVVVVVGGRRRAHAVEPRTSVADAASARTATRRTIAVASRRGSRWAATTTLPSSGIAHGALYGYRQLLHAGSETPPTSPWPRS
jgi:hypothetical protein